MEGAAGKNQNQTPKQEEEDEMRGIVKAEEVEKLEQSLPKTTVMGGMLQLVNYQGFWYPLSILKNVLAFQKHFQARNSDVIIASSPKTGNTWLKALLFAIINRHTTKTQNSLLHQKHPHEVVPFLEGDFYGQAFDYPRPQHLNELPSPRLFHTHFPFHSLPNSIKTSGCRILYICRNPLDTFVSMYYFSTSSQKMSWGEEFHKFQLPTMEDFVKSCYVGESPFGPFFDHVVEYWKQSQAQPEKILFLMYEDLKQDPSVELKKVAEFIGIPFSAKEESEGVIAQIIDLCSFNNLKQLQPNMSGVINQFFEKKSYFRKGEVGDWSNHISPPLLDELNQIMNEKIGGTGLSFKFLPS